MDALHRRAGLSVGRCQRLARARTTEGRDESLDSDPTGVEADKGFGFQDLSLTQRLGDRGRGRRGRYRM
jgi:hypothetical protein